jgi:hypothetical protein
MRTPQQVEAMVPVSDRSAQRFPRLRPEQLAVVKRFAEAPARSFAPDESIFQAGHHGVPTWFLLEGSAELFSLDGLDDETSLRMLASGQFTTGLSAADTQAPIPPPLQTSLSRVFAIGDVRSGSTKRVASAVGEGAAVVAQIHSILGA